MLGIGLQDVQADSAGGVLLVTRRGDCHTGPLCGGTSSPCNTMHLIRFDLTGHQVWDRHTAGLTVGFAFRDPVDARHREIGQALLPGPGAAPPAWADVGAHRRLVRGRVPPAGGGSLALTVNLGDAAGSGGG